MSRKRGERKETEQVRGREEKRKLETEGEKWEL